jgi:hypothetical protein
VILTLLPDPNAHGPLVGAGDRQGARR